MKASSAHPKKFLVGILVLVASAAPGCSEDDPDTDDPQGVFDVNGQVVVISGGDTAMRNAAVFWSVSSGSPDYTYKFGEGDAEGTKFFVTFSANPPAEALNSYGVGIGVVATFAPGVALPPDGIVDDNIFYSLTGITAQDAIIFKAPDAQELDWSPAFPEGFSCGKCVPAGTETFDSFEPTDCSTMKLETDIENAEVCNWT